MKTTILLVMLFLGVQNAKAANTQTVDPSTAPLPCAMAAKGCQNPFSTDAACGVGTAQNIRTASQQKVAR